MRIIRVFSAFPPFYQTRSEIVKCPNPRVVLTLANTGYKNKIETITIQYTLRLSRQNLVVDAMQQYYACMYRFWQKPKILHFFCFFVTWRSIVTHFTKPKTLSVITKYETKNKDNFRF